MHCRHGHAVWPCPCSVALGYAVQLSCVCVLCKGMQCSRLAPGYAVYGPMYVKIMLCNVAVARLAPRYAVHCLALGE